MTDRDRATRVVKLGGSLFDLPRMPERVQAWLAGQPARRSVIVCGGGVLADGVRELDRRFALNEASAHWLAVRTMTIHAELLVAVCPWMRLARTLAECLVGEPERPWVLDPWHFLREVEPTLPGVGLPASWSVTSDSIAARVASALGAGELVLLKSALPPGGATLRGAVDSGYVDGFFRTAAHALGSVCCVNLSDERFPYTIVADDDGRTGNGANRAAEP